MSRSLPASILILLLWLLMACSDSRCPENYVLDGKLCKRCPAGTEAQGNQCVATEKNDDASLDANSVPEEDSSMRASEAMDGSSDGRVELLEAGKADSGGGMDGDASDGGVPQDGGNGDAVSVSDASTKPDATPMQEGGAAPDSGADAASAHVPTGRWPFDEGSGTSTADTSANHDDGVLVDGAGWADGILNKAVSLDGENDRVHIPAHAAPRYMGGDLTIAVWIYLDGNDSDGGYLVSKPLNGNGSYNYQVAIDDDGKVVVRLMLGNAASLSFSSLHLLAKGAWHHLAVSFSRDKVVALFLDGALDATSTHSITSWNAEQNGNQELPLVLGFVYPYQFNATVVASDAVKGKIDDFRIYDVALGWAEVAQIYNRAYGY